jgi:uncharacterized Zn finger protein
MNAEIKHHKETIKCPECNKAQEGEVMHTWPFYTYFHQCDGCGYTIMESEWIKID